MIRHRVLLYIALVAAGLAVARRHAAILDEVPFAPGIIERYLPATHILLGFALIMIIINLVPFQALFAERRQEVHSRREFRKEGFAVIARRVFDMGKASRPDVPLIIDYIIFQAIEADASDIHLDPDRAGFAVLFRIDGIMSRVAEVPTKLQGAVTNRLKVLSNLVVYQGFLPQDGRLDREGSNHRTKPSAGAELRIAFMPTLHGERIVIRILGRAGGFLSFGDLGMGEEAQKLMRRFIAMPQGMIILTGPTGSGKTTTIYSALRAIREESGAEKSIATLEDPIEYEVPGINQSQVDEKKGYTFDKGLRAMLRQDPDVIMVGEIRDAETARIAIQAGMTGHLIITTVHANSSSATFSRLLEMGIAAYSLNSSLTAIIAQRLVRRLCITCRKERPLTDDEITGLGLNAEEARLPAFDATGCSDCGGTGYKGRYALFEILEVIEPIRALVAAGTSADAIYLKAREQGMHTLFESGIDAVAQGITSPSDVLRAVVDDRH